MVVQVIFLFGSVGAVRALELGFDSALVALMAFEVTLPLVAFTAPRADVGMALCKIGIRRKTCY
jgi:hypothetical protein